MQTSKSKINLTKQELEVELFNAYFRALNRINQLIALNIELDNPESKVINDALQILREKLELAKADYYTNTNEVNRG